MMKMNCDSYVCLEENDHHSNTTSGDDFAGIVERLYRDAMRLDRTYASRIAFAYYLASHGREREALDEFRALTMRRTILCDSTLQSQIRHAIEQIENRMAGNAFLE